MWLRLETESANPFLRPFFLLVKKFLSAHQVFDETSEVLEDLDSIESIEDVEDALSPWEREVEIFEWSKTNYCYESYVINNPMLQIFGMCRVYEIIRKGINPIISTYGTLIDVYSKAGLKETYHKQKAMIAHEKILKNVRLILWARYRDLNGSQNNNFES